MPKLKVRFVETVTVQNGSGVKPGPTYEAGSIQEFEEPTALYWCNRRCGVLMGDDAAPASLKLVGGETPPADPPPKTPAVDHSDVDLDSLTVKQLGEFADANHIDLGTLTKKGEIIARVSAELAARAARASGTGGG